MLPSEIVCTGV